VRNGIDLTRYAGVESAVGDRTKIIWSSSPDRGLSTLVQMIPILRRIEPGLTVHVYYGLNVLESAAQKGSADAERIIRDVMAMIEKNREFLVWHGRVGQDELAAAQIRAQWWIYPTRFTEVSCITALEAQAARMNIVAASTAALTETIHGGGIAIDGSPDAPPVFMQYVGYVADWLQNPSEAAYTGFAQQQQANVLNQTWERVFEEDWLPLLRGVL